MRRPFFKNRKFFILIPPIFLAFIALVGWVVMWLWNHVMTDIFLFKAITFWQALGLLALVRILTGGFSKGRGWGGFRGSRAWKEKWMNMNEEEKIRFREDWKRRCGKMDEAKGA